jgi:hypothetical protein
MQNRVHVMHGCRHGSRIEQVEFGPSRGVHLVPVSLRERPERSSENTGSPGYE